MRRLCLACCIGAIAAGLAFPYYLDRYEKQEGRFLPVNIELAKFGRVTTAMERLRRDQHRIAFVKSLLWGTSKGTQPMQDRDQQVLRMLNTWKDVWSANVKNILQSPLSLALSVIYANLSLVFLTIGCIYAVVRSSLRTAWDRFGCVLVTFALVEIAALIFYTYEYPHPIGVENKAIYIAPALLGFGYLVTLTSRMAGTIQIPKSLVSKIFIGIGIISVSCFMIFNTVLPVY